MKRQASNPTNGSKIPMPGMQRPRVVNGTTQDGSRKDPPNGMTQKGSRKDPPTVVVSVGTSASEDTKILVKIDEQPSHSAHNR